MNYTIVCCEKMTERLAEDELICVLDSIPFTNSRTKSEPTCYLQSDGGHGGMAKIDYCPFCGESIEIKEVQND